MNTEYQVGDLLCRCVDENDMYIITTIPEEYVYIIACMRTYKFYGYDKESIDRLFQKVSQ